MSLTIEDILLNDYKDQANEDYLKLQIQHLIQEKVIHDCTFFVNWTQSYYRENLKRIFQIQINYQKQKNEKKLLLAQAFYKYCSVPDILEYLNETISIDQKLY
jgi:hypothetical protein